MAFPSGATWFYLVLSHGFTWCRHMALPSVATWLYLMVSYGLIRCRHMALPGLAMCHRFTILAHACLPCVIHMAPHRVMTMHG